MSQLLTLSKKDPEFLNYLLGRFSKTHRALPIESLNIDTDSEQVTFEIKPIKEIRIPPWWKAWPQILKLKNTILVAFPLFLILVKNVVDNTIDDYLIAFLGALGAFLLQIGVNLRNDFLDHLSGLDRVHPQSGSRAIQNGWLAAYQVRRWSWLFLWLGVLCGLPCLVVYPEMLWLVLVLIVIVMFGILFYRSGLRYRLWTEFAAFLLYGPLLSIGYQIAISGLFDFESIVMGIAHGWFSVFILHIRNFENLLVNSQAGFTNSMTKFGFEKAKHFLNFWWIGYIFLYNVYHLLYGAQVWIWVMTVGSLVISLNLIRAVSQLLSPVGSEVSRAVERARRSAYFLMGLWVLEGLIHLLVLEFG